MVEEKNQIKIAGIVEFSLADQLEDFTVLELENLISLAELKEVKNKLFSDRRGMRKELEENPLEASEIEGIIRNITLQIIKVKEAIKNLEEKPEEDEEDSIEPKGVRAMFGGGVRTEMKKGYRFGKAMRGRGRY